MFVGHVGGEPVALCRAAPQAGPGRAPLHLVPRRNVGATRRRRHGPARGPGHIGAQLLWRAMARDLTGADLVYLRSIPVDVGVHSRLFRRAGHVAAGGNALPRPLHLLGKECDRVQRSKSRRKHDRQQGDRLNALGEVDFAEVTEPAAARTAIATMFEQRSARFRAQGIRDTFVIDDLIGFYHAAAQRGRASTCA